MPTYKYIYKGRPAVKVARENGISKSAFDSRIHDGWSVERACTEKTIVDPIEELVCEQCGKVFTRKKSHSVGKHVYCSKDCYILSITKKIEKKCAFCGKKFLVAPSDLETAKFCSKECCRLASRKVFKIITDDEIMYYKRKYRKSWFYAAKRYSIPACYRDEFFNHIDYYLFKNLFYTKLDDFNEAFEKHLVKLSIKQALGAYLQENFNQYEGSIEDFKPFEWEGPFPSDDSIYFKQKLKLLKQSDEERNDGYKYLLKMYFNDWDICDLARNEGIEYNKIYYAIEKVKEYAKSHRI